MDKYEKIPTFRFNDNNANPKIIKLFTLKNRAAGNICIQTSSGNWKKESYSYAFCSFFIPYDNDDSARNIKIKNISGVLSSTTTFSYVKTNDGIEVYADMQGGLCFASKTMNCYNYSVNAIIIHNQEVDTLPDGAVTINIE